MGGAEFQAQVTSYEAAIESAKVELHKIIVNYQELLDIKQALDVEIATYKKLLEGEDIKWVDNICNVYARFNFCSLCKTFSVIMYLELTP